MKPLRLKLFGVLRIYDAMGQKVPIAGTKANLLLTYLALRLGRPQSREKLMGLLWSDRGDSQARGSLRQALWAIRQEIEKIHPHPLVVEGDTVALDPATVEVDIIDFETHLADGAPDSLQSALDLYQGEFLEGTRIRDPVFENLLRTERLRLHGLVVDACNRLLRHQVHAGMKHAAIATAKRLVGIDSLQEAAHRILMEYYADTGQLSLALKQYQTCCESLIRELDVAPEAETEELFNRIRRTRPSPAETSSDIEKQHNSSTTNQHTDLQTIDTYVKQNINSVNGEEGQFDQGPLIKCSRCQQQNAANQKFCGGCGKSLTSNCSNCGSTNPSNQNYCGTCGAALTRPDAPSRFASPHDYTPEHLTDKILTYKNALEGERKQVTVVFAELIGSMQLVADRDSEGARKILDPLLEVMIGAVQRYEGIVSKVLGDGITALFGVPLAHEDHAVRACYTALAIRDALKEKTIAVTPTQRVTPRVRIGINSGEIVIGGIDKNLSIDYDTVGPTILLAGRMEQLADPNTIRLTDNTLRLAEGFIKVNRLSPEIVEGLRQPIQSFELAGAAPARSRFHATVDRGLTHFVGRDRELDALGRAGGCAINSQGQVFAIVGEPGVGKSRLLYEFTSAHRNIDWLMLESSSASYDKTTPFLPVIDLLKMYFNITDHDEPQDIQTKLSSKLMVPEHQLEPTYTALLSLLHIPINANAWQDLDPRQRRQQTQQAVKRLFLNASESKPLLIIIEDLQWVDSETQALLDDLVESLPKAKILLIVSYRPEYSHAWFNKTYYTQRRIDPLPTESASKLLQSLLGTTTELIPLNQAIITRTEGNPFFVEESVRSLVETGVLQGNQGDYRVTKELHLIDVPATVQGVLMARIDRLAPGDKQLLQTASVIGEDFSYALLAAITGQTDKVLQNCLATLRGAEFIYETHLYPNLEYTFKHALTHDVVYATLLNEQRRELHSRIVTAIEQLYPDRLHEQIERLAHHAFQGEQWQRAEGFLHQSGNKSTANGGYREAASYLEKALVALSHLPKSRETLQQGIELRFALRSTLQALGEHDQVFEHLREAQKLAYELDDQDRLGWSSAYLSQYLWRMGSAEEAEKTGQRALLIASNLNDFSLEVVTNFFLGQGYFNIGDYPHAIDHCLQNVVALTDQHIYERLGLTGLPSVLSRIWLAWSLGGQGNFVEAMEHAQKALTIADFADQVYSMAAARLGIGQIQAVKGDFAQAILILEQAMELCQQWNLGVIQPSVNALLGHCYAKSGEAEKALPMLEESENQTPEIRIFRTPLETTALAYVYLKTGRLKKAQSTASRLAEYSEKGGFKTIQARVSHLLGDIDSRLNWTEMKDTEAHYLHALDLANQLGMSPLVAHCHLGLGRLYALNKNFDSAKQQLSGAAKLYQKMKMDYWLKQVDAELSKIALVAIGAS